MFQNACTAPRFDLSGPSGKAAILDQINKLLTSEQCQEAVAAIEPVYHSVYTDNQVRLLRAASHACFSGLNFVELLNSLITADLSGIDWFWQFMTQYYYPTGVAGVARTSLLEGRIQSSFYALDALMASIPSGRVINASNQFNPTSIPVDFFNLASLAYTDRTDDSNIYLFFVSMAAMGNVQNLYGNPDASYDRQTDLPWVTSALMDTTGCGYAGAIASLFDSTTVMSTVGGAAVRGVMANVTGGFSIFIDQACANGCAGMDWDGTAGFEAACNFSCTTCPAKIRYRENCATDPETACAAAGLIRYMNSPLGWD